MSIGLFLAGLAAWTIFDNPNYGCLFLSLAWLLHSGEPDDDGPPRRYG
jgi:hypothetical protein